MDANSEEMLERWDELSDRNMLSPLWSKHLREVEAILREASTAVGNASFGVITDPFQLRHDMVTKLQKIPVE